MPGTRPHIANQQARRIFLDRHALLEPPTGSCRGAGLQDLVTRLGFVQIDSINTVARAQDMILFSRRQSYRSTHLRTLLERRRGLFEHWTHDASVIPMAFFPHWHLRFGRDRARLMDRWTSWRRGGFEQKFDEVLRRISDHGPVSSADVGETEQRTSGGWWDWHPSKTALEYLWRTGALSVVRREGFRKIYDLTERVIPAAILATRPAVSETVDWACATAMDRLGFATTGELAAFWQLVTPQEARRWCEDALQAGRIVEVDVGLNDGRLRRSFARPETLAAPLPRPSPRVRILSPFDPALRDRQRAHRLFGFHYRIEIFVPAPKRRYGYYVFPVLEGDRPIGRIDMKCDRPAGRLMVRAFWPEAGVGMGLGRQRRLEAELARVARFSGCPNLEFRPGWMRQT